MTCNKHACYLLRLANNHYISPSCLERNIPQSPTCHHSNHDTPPNVFNSGYTCASILNTEDGYTPAYKLKGITIQLLSLFSSDYITQEGGRLNIDLKSCDREMREEYVERVNSYCCIKCGFGRIKPLGGGSVASGKDLLANPFAKQCKLDAGDEANSPGSVPAKGTMEFEKTNQPQLIDRILTLPDELSLQLQRCAKRSETVSPRTTSSECANSNAFV